MHDRKRISIIIIIIIIIYIIIIITIMVVRHSAMLREERDNTVFIPQSSVTHPQWSVKTTENRQEN